VTVDEMLTANQIKALLFAGAILLIAVTSWWAGRRARQVLGRALGREVREGEETSLRAWMSVPTATLATVDDELRNKAAEQVLQAVDTMGRQTRHGRGDHEPYSDHTSIR
jgi:hypothetical protein